MKKLFLDAGHGGKDNGASGNGIHEKDVVLQIAKKIEEGLKAYDGIEVMMSRTSDVYLTLDERTDKANKWDADVFLSIHINSSTTTTGNGFGSYIYSFNPGEASIALQNIMHAEITKQIRTNDRGKDSANFHVLRESNMPAILTENLFISNAADSKLLKSDEFLNRCALGHIFGIVKFLGLKKKETAPTPDKIYRVQVGAFADKQNANDLAERLLKDGYKPYIVEA
jgi:N-acetylmuramoyl-L-alanine amidase